MTDIDFAALRRDEAEQAAERARLRVALLADGWSVSGGMGHLLEPTVVLEERNQDDLPRNPRSCHIVLNHTGAVKLGRYDEEGTVSEQTFEGHLNIDEIVASARTAAAWVALERAELNRQRSAEQISEAVEFFNEAGDLKVTPAQLAEITNLRSMLDVVRDHGFTPMAVLAPPGWLGVEGQGSIIFGLAIWQDEHYKVPCLAMGLQ